jgi:predicted Fe-S protein YdhL (DUF1289 family)
MRAPKTLVCRGIIQLLEKDAIVRGCTRTERWRVI